MVCLIRRLLLLLCSSCSSSSGFLTHLSLGNLGQDNAADNHDDAEGDPDVHALTQEQPCDDCAQCGIADVDGQDLGHGSVADSGVQREGSNSGEQAGFLPLIIDIIFDS